MKNLLLESVRRLEGASKIFFIDGKVYEERSGLSMK
jgi:hypothetical protein